MREFIGGPVVRGPNFHYQCPRFAFWSGIYEPISLMLCPKRRRKKKRWKMKSNNRFIFFIHHVFATFIQRTTCKDFRKSCKVGIEVVKKTKRIGSQSVPSLPKLSLYGPGNICLLVQSLKVKIPASVTVSKSADFFPF